jgi:hypothetical protein
MAALHKDLVSPHAPGAPGRPGSSSSRALLTSVRAGDVVLMTSERDLSTGQVRQRLDQGVLEAVAAWSRHLQVMAAWSELHGRGGPARGRQAPSSECTECQGPGAPP